MPFSCTIGSAKMSQHRTIVGADGACFVAHSCGTFVASRIRQLCPEVSSNGRCGCVKQGTARSRTQVLAPGLPCTTGRVCSDYLIASCPRQAGNALQAGCASQTLLGLSNLVSMRHTIRSAHASIRQR